jgi:septal ring factor EnvC (AmiA/AmiB activator)
MWPFRGMIMCHMFATTNEELEDMRRKLKLLKSWEQEPRDSIGPHYDIAKSKRVKAARRRAQGQAHAAAAAADKGDDLCQSSPPHYV